MGSTRGAWALLALTGLGLASASLLAENDDFQTCVQTDSSCTTMDLSLLTGTIPTSIGEATSLLILSLQGPKETGPSLEGELPSEIGALTGLQSLKILHNSLEGSLPTTFGQLTTLHTLDLSYNKIGGPIPTQLGLLTDLKLLDLEDNALTGKLPTELGKLSLLEKLILKKNSLTGPIPSELGKLTALLELALHENSLTSPIPAQLSLLSSLEKIDLGENKLTGPIPSSFGQLTRLHYLELYSNSLTGTIPTHLGKLTGLSVLALRTNQLSGTLPTELGLLNKLGHLFLASNLLYGVVPESYTNMILNQEGDPASACHAPGNYLDAGCMCTLEQKEGPNATQIEWNELYFENKTSTDNLEKVCFLENYQKDLDKKFEREPPEKYSSWFDVQLEFAGDLANMTAAEKEAVMQNLADFLGLPRLNVYVHTITDADGHVRMQLHLVTAQSMPPIDDVAMNELIASKTREELSEILGVKLLSDFKLHPKGWLKPLSGYFMPASMHMTCNMCMRHRCTLWGMNKCAARKLIKDPDSGSGRHECMCRCCAEQCEVQHSGCESYDQRAELPAGSSAALGQPHGNGAQWVVAPFVGLIGIAIVFAAHMHRRGASTLPTLLE